MRARVGVVDADASRRPARSLGDDTAERFEALRADACASPSKLTIVSTAIFKVDEAVTAHAYLHSKQWFEPRTTCPGAHDRQRCAAPEVAAISQALH